MGVWAGWALLGGILVGAQEIDPAEVRRLVELLDADDPAERDRAYEALARQGKAVVSHLKGLVGGLRPEPAVRIRKLLERFDWEEGLERTLPPVRRVSLERGRRAVAEILREVERQSGYRIVPQAVERDREVDIGWNQVPVLQALDELCAALGSGSLRLPAMGLGADVFEERGTKEPAGAEDLSSGGITLDGKGRVLPVAHRDQFRAVVNSVVAHELPSRRGTWIGLTFGLAAQPGTRALARGFWKVLEATDDLGNPLVSGEEENPNDVAATVERMFPLPGDDPEAVWFEWGVFSTFWPWKPRLVSIQGPGRGGRRLTRLRAKVLLVFGRDFHSRTLTVRDVKPEGILRFSPRVALHLTRAEATERTFRVSCQVRGSCYGKPEIELLDEAGRPVDGIHTMNRFDHEWKNVSAPVASLRVAAWVGARAIEVPFEFRDVPLPDLGR